MLPLISEDSDGATSLDSEAMFGSGNGEDMPYNIPSQPLRFIPKDVGVQIADGNFIQLNLRNDAGKQIFVTLNQQQSGALGFHLTLNTAKSYKTEANPQPDIPFDTEMTAAIMMGGNSSGGNIIVRFLTPEGVWLTTMLGPEASARLSNDLNTSLSQMPVPPKLWKMPSAMSAPLKGATKSKDTTVYFGQEYPRDIVEMLGVLMIRANLLENALIKLLSFASGMSEEKASVAFFSSQNNKARIDTIKNFTITSDLKKDDKDWIIECLERAQTLANQRNLLVHGEWEFVSDKFSVKERRAVPNNKSQNTITSKKSLYDLASRFYDLTGSINMHLMTYR